MAETTTQDGKWYIVHAYSGFEKKVAQAIKDQAIRKGMGDLIQEALVPTEEVVEMRRGQRVSSERKFLPGYVLVRMVMSIMMAVALLRQEPYMFSGMKEMNGN